MSEQEVWHGDALILAPKLPDGIKCVVTDPPYGVNFRSQRAETGNGKKFVADIANDKDLTMAVILFEEVMASIIPKMEEDSDLYVFTRWDIVNVWMEAVRALPDIAYKMLLVWDKGIPGMGDIDSNWGCGHELILYCKKGRREVSHRRSGIIHVDKVHPTKIIHPTEKPVGLIEILIEMSTNKGDLVVDPFSGSGSTAVAAQRTGRSAIGIEMEDKYVQASRDRLGELVMDF
jgi:site-specific DNA-methyltransferase (adenine-specific)